VKVYYHAIAWDNEREVFIELTPNAQVQLDKLAEDEPTYRGLVVSIKKSKGGAKGRYFVELYPRKVLSDNLPEERDPLNVLRFLWACKNNVSTSTK